MPLPTRRMLLAGSALALGLHAREQARKLKVLVTRGHPGDPEYGCGGTIARFSELGHAVTILYLNHGEKGCAGKSADACAATLTAEAHEACRILKAIPRFASSIDGEAVPSS